MRDSQINATGSSRRWVSHAPQVDGERFVCVIRLVLVMLSIFTIIGYVIISTSDLYRSLFTAGISLLSWALLSTMILWIIERSFYRTWLSIISVVVDVFVVTGVQIALILSLPLNFVNGPITMVYFVIIGLAAIRRSRWLVKMTGVLSAVAHLFTSAIAYYLYAPEGYILSSLESFMMKFSFLDEVGVILAILIVAWVVAYVTNQLRELEDHYHSLFETVPDGIIIASSEQRILNVNQRFEEMLGLPKDQIVGRSVIEFLGQKLSRRELTPSISGIFGSPTTLIRPNAPALHVRTVAMPIEYNNEICVEMSVRDVANQIKLQRRLLQSQKMKTIGKLVGGLAHDFNNILGGIIGASSLAEITISKIDNDVAKEKLSQHIAVIKDCGDQARDIVSRLLTFSETSIIKTDSLDLNTLASELSVICRNTFDSNILISTEGTEEPLTVEGDSTALRQAVLNLCINAKDAMPEGGELNIKVMVVDPSIDITKRLPELDQSEEYCCISVSDTGCGMSEATIERIFDPFFTTKPKGEGTGLGLSMVFIIARQHGGCVEVFSVPGQSSVFNLYLTRSRDSLLPPEPIEHNDLPKGEGNILIVDDDESVRSTVHEMLTRLGYKVQTSINGLDALNVLEKPDCNIDLVLLDMMMPVMDGAKTLEELRRRENNVKIIVTSGFLGDEAFGRIENYNITDHLKKPFTYETLAGVVKNALL